MEYIWYVECEIFSNYLRKEVLNMAFLNNEAIIIHVFIIIIII